MQPKQLFRFCPQCGTATNAGANPLRCQACGLHFYFNPTLAAAAFLFDDAGRAIFIRRARDPGIGKLTVPGGFVDIGETAEEALAREVREEVGLAIADVRYVCSLTNLYFYKNVTYPVCDLMFCGRALQPETAAALDGATSFVWLKLTDVDPEELAFPSVKRGLAILLEAQDPRTLHSSPNR